MLNALSPFLTTLLSVADRLFRACLSGAWSDWRSSLVIVKFETVIARHRKGVRLFWTWKVGTEQLEGLPCRAKSGT